MFTRLIGFLFGWMRKPSAWVLIGLIILALLIWYIGPIISIGSVAPLSSVWARVFLICLLFGIYLFRRLIAFWRSRSINQRFLGMLADARDARAKAKSSSKEAGESEVLRKRFGDAIAVLKKARFKEEGSSFARLFSGKQYIYQLPWYVIIGAPGSGKTTVLANSGLEFPLASVTGRGSVKGVGGTRNCDWWFTNQAVLLDTAGRYTTHESDELADREEWHGFLGLIKRFRPRQPINGVLVTISVSDLLGGDETTRKRYALHVRSRLDELRSVFGMRFPAYFLVTKCDLLSGFSEYFAGLDRVGRAQVWGFTLPRETDNQSRGLRDQLQQEFGLLQDQLHGNLIDVMQRAHDQASRALGYAFPQQFEGITSLILDFVQDVAVESRYQEAAEIRGIYFTSGTQEGAPFDRVLSGLDATFHASVSKRKRSDGTGLSYFIHDTLRRVVFPEAHLVGANQKQDTRLRRLRYAGYAASIGLLLLAVTGWLISYRNNLSYIAEVDVKTDQLAKEVSTISRTDNDDLIALLPLLSRAATVADSSQFEFSAPHLSWTFGLYQGYKLHAAGDLVYRKLLAYRFATALNVRLETLLRSMEVGDLEFAFETLRAYLMLHDAKRFNDADFQGFMLADWDMSMPSDPSQTERGQYSGHLAALGSLNEGVTLAGSDSALIQDARARLVGYTLAQRVYSRLKRKLWNNQLPDFSIARVAGEQAAAVFKRRSGKSITDGVPSLYSYRGYYELFLPEIDPAIRMIGQDDAWVLGESRSEAALRKEQLSGAMALEVKRLYMRDYVLAWEGFLGDIGLMKVDTLLDAVQLAKALSSPDSPLSLLVKAAAIETTLSKESVRSGDRSLFDRMKNSARATRDDVTRVVGTSVMPGQLQPTDKPELIVDRRFEALRRMAGGREGSTAAIDSTLKSLSELYSFLAASEAAIASGSPPPKNDALLQRLKSEAAQLPLPLREVVEKIATSSEVQLANEVRKTGTKILHAEITQFCQTAISGKYPFSRGSSNDVTPGDFARLFGPNQKFDDYFRRNLADIVDVSTRPWTLRPGARGEKGVGVDISAFQKAQAIRDVFFRAGGDISKISLTLKPLEMDSAITSFVLDIDGQIVRYRHGPQVAQTITWPGPRGSNQVRITMEPASVNGASGDVKEGPWALFRLFDSAKIVPGASPERFVVTLTIGGRHVAMEVTASSVQNPFRMSEISSFVCPSSL